jgi:hypothetical protein
MTGAVKAVAPDAGTLAQNNTGYFSTSPSSMNAATMSFELRALAGRDEIAGLDAAARSTCADL